MGLSSDPRQYKKIFRQLRKEWKNNDCQNFKRAIRKLSDRKYIEEKKFPDGTIKLILTKQGRREAGRFSLLRSSLKLEKPKRWDGKWRLVIFDIPEKERAFRSILREHLRELDFHKLQHSVFASQYPFEKAIIELVRIYSAEAYVRVITADKIDNQERLKKIF